MKALELVGVRDNNAADYGAIDLRYTTFSSGLPAVAVISIDHSSFDHAAVAVLSAGHWKRVAVFECWCKYETPLEDFVHVTQSYGDGVQLQIIARASGGGTVLYEQTEAWFGLRNGALKDLLSFVRRKRSCNGGECDYERRWFDGNQLVEGRSPATEYRTDEDGMFREQLLGWEVPDSAIKSFACTPYKWDAAKFTYAPSGGPHHCKYEPPH